MPKASPSPGLGRAIGGLAAAARAGTLTADDLRGSTFTLTNNGAFGTLMTAPIVNPPNVAILSTDAVEERVVAIDGMNRDPAPDVLVHVVGPSRVRRLDCGEVPRSHQARTEERDWTGQL